MDPWYRIVNVDEVASPTLLIFPERVEENLRRMIATAGGAHRLRPHVKTHKLPQVLALQIAHGITRFKAATIAEAEMCGMGGAAEVLLAYPLVGPNPRRLVALVREYPGTRFQCVVDHPSGAEALSRAAVEAGVEIEVLLDLNVGMDRTGILPG
ncbi:MAG: alanine racemase, partial [Verrucomicrobiota bacterium]